MRRIRNTVTINSITILIALAMIADFSMVSGCLKTTVSTRDRVDELIEVVHHFLDKAAEPALFIKSDENRLPDLKINFLRYFAFSEPIFDESDFCFSHFRASLKNSPLDYNLPVKIKLLI